MWTTWLGEFATVPLWVIALSLAVHAADSSKKRVQPSHATKAESSENRFEISESNGPWMVFAASFAGPGAEDDALALVHELRQDRIPAYLHAQNFDFSKPVQGLRVVGHPLAVEATHDEVQELQPFGRMGGARR